MLWSKIFVANYYCNIQLSTYLHFILCLLKLNSYKDWFTQDWHDKVRDYEWDPGRLRDTKSNVNLETDSVPYRYAYNIS